MLPMPMLLLLYLRLGSTGDQWATTLHGTSVSGRHTRGQEAERGKGSAGETPLREAQRMAQILSLHPPPAVGLLGLQGAPFNPCIPLCYWRMGYDGVSAGWAGDEED
ncbi:predicted protein [Verticillium alfalfae VaMs.102]|uniref:Predicted protein n=1 Tax=Verticillium alfalfae (strain VaMs.102 / ATCC MYA-4576 / FGSC 10136) TaxID=526221 RepID=C9S8T5_VERA1|nr:predicted protein [Verticillium alfalfae VaMs.102]EEY14012.1 predicted protein [Verticillium alfalfae VaMs.102]